jgi:uncharacterized membrane protein
MNQLEPNTSAGSNAKVIYILYLVSIIVGLTSLVGVVMAYIYRQDAPDWVRSHYRFQIRTFWIGLLYVVVGMLLTAAFIGFLILLFWLVWLIMRCVKGMQQLERGEPVSDEVTWLWPK